jgi:hypothetical protein
MRMDERIRRTTRMGKQDGTWTDVIPNGQTSKNKLPRMEH